MLLTKPSLVKKEIREIVEDYMWLHRPERNSELGWYAAQTNFRQALELAVVNELPQARRGVEYRSIASSMLRNLVLELKAQDLEDCRSFDQLLRKIKTGCENVGQETLVLAYDIALRIGAFTGLEADYIYLEGGVQKGAANLGLEVSGRDYCSLEELPEAFHLLTPAEAADCLWIYRNQFR